MVVRWRLGLVSTRVMLHSAVAPVLVTVTADMVAEVTRSRGKAGWKINHNATDKLAMKRKISKAQITVRQRNGSSRRRKARRAGSRYRSST